jgi:hypothetical protein
MLSLTVPPALILAMINGISSPDREQARWLGTGVAHDSRRRKLGVARLLRSTARRALRGAQVGRRHTPRCPTLGVEGGSTVPLFSMFLLASARPL